MKLLLFALFSIGSMANAALQPSFQGFVPVKSGTEIYVEHYAPKGTQPTVVLVNGLVYNIHRWDPYTEELTRKGFGVVRYYFRGQLDSLLREVEIHKTPKFFEGGFTYQDLASELNDVLNQLKITGKVSVVGLSYGGSIAAEFASSYPRRVDQLILMAPLVVSLDHYDPMGAWIRWNLDAVRFWWGPLWGPAAYDYYYDMIFRSFLVDQRITSDRIPPEVAHIPDIYKETVFHQVRATRDFNLKTYDFAKGPRVHLFLASEEDVPAFEDQLRAWEKFSGKKRGSLVYFEKSGHAIPDAAPALSADVTAKLLRGQTADGLYRVGRGKTEVCKDIRALRENKCK